MKGSQVYGNIVQLRFEAPDECTEYHRTFVQIIVMNSSTTTLVSQKKEVKKNKVSVAEQKLSRKKAKPNAYARFDTRLPQETKEILERAAFIKGFKSLSEFVIHFSSEAALSIIERHNQILASEKDQAIFFETLINPPAPNKALIKAAKRYKTQIAGL